MRGKFFFGDENNAQHATHSLHAQRFRSTHLPEKINSQPHENLIGNSKRWVPSHKIDSTQSITQISPDEAKSHSITKIIPMTTLIYDVCHHFLITFRSNSLLWLRSALGPFESITQNHHSWTNRILIGKCVFPVCLVWFGCE